MSLLDLFSNWWRDEQTHWTLQAVQPPDGHAPDPELLPLDGALVPNQAYVRVMMRSMSISATRRGWTVFHAALYSSVSLGLRTGTLAEMQAVLSPDFFRRLDRNRLKNVMMIDRVIFGPVPYTGGPMKMQMGVFAVKDADLAAPFIGSLVSIASVAGVAYVAAAQPFIGPIKDGIELLAGSGDAVSLEVGLDHQQDPVRTGWFALVRAPAGSIQAGSLSVRSDSLELLRNGASMPGVPYLLYSIEGLRRRGDHAQIKELAEVYNDFRDAADRGDASDAGDFVTQFRRRALLSPELLPAHADEIAAAVDTQYRTVFGSGRALGIRPATSVRPAEPSTGSESRVTSFENLPVSF